MAFVQPPPGKRAGRPEENKITLRASTFRNRTMTTLSIPRQLLRQAGLSDIPGERVDVLVGTGEHAGQIAVVHGDRYSMFKQGLHRVAVSTTVLLDAPLKAAHCAFEIGRKQLVIALPREAVLRSAGATAPVSIAAE